MNIQEILNKWEIKADANILLSMWNESTRDYHSLSHLTDLFDQIDRMKLDEKDYEKLVIGALFHDIVYDPKAKDNEEQSAIFFINCCVDKSNKDIQEIKQAILDTKTHKSTTKLSSMLNEIDMSIVERSYDELLEWERGIYNEYKFVGNEKYKKGRLEFLESLLDKYIGNSGNILKLISWVKENY